MKLNDPLTKDDIELRIGQTSPKGFSLLLYKTARTDVRRLDAVYPDLWKNRYYYDQNGLLCCEISVYNKDIKEWVSRTDVGTESFTEKEKGSYSDAFKRAGFKWNIGTELYSSPFIWINWPMKVIKGKHQPDGFYSSNLVIDDYQVVDGKVKGLTISYKGKGVIFDIKAPVKQESNSLPFKSKAELNRTLKSFADCVINQDFETAKETADEMTKDEKKYLIDYLENNEFGGHSAVINDVTFGEINDFIMEIKNHA